ncbi:MAG: hypothetical protein A2900_03960 [Candidatus Chisholmbacteria bacterium RIFCSPLOWO2_01_FULL_50_28]|uniref:ribose-phosphate diphosphokinase n=1 Tax=Candidatus Chisholmbacteria bacterium RIFCSPHIGHO2_01_FULL_52_32 TaxID=1797591 RepID=A0A1G1VSL8_9BACT|nr:MAG: hypothetical protein A2786_02785 [Candidatus Chisholmbacteria bacterium RIFCSPHIGHO2_01_FULL_52_32]OGY20226.1 MAG: hypothetical protein A2900_03960 [Candidatus Chisholmbacteria bacterium RIFCSPLOWO2_01_FULL_50_28]
MKETLTIVSGSSHPAFAEGLAEFLQASVTKRELSVFPNGELRARILGDVRGKTVVVVQSLFGSAGAQLIEFALLIDAVKRGFPQKVIGIIPWLAYSLQDEQFRTGEPISSESIARLIDALKLSELILIDLHSLRTASYFKTQTRVIAPSEIFKDMLIGRYTENTLIVAPDDGARTRAMELASLVNGRVLVLKKVRDRQTLKIEYGKVKGNVAGKDCILCDDVVVTGDTLVEAATLLKESGAKSAAAFCTHALFIKGSSDRISRSQIDEITVTDTLPITKAQQFDKLKIVSAIPAVGRAVSALTKKGSGL